MVRAMPAAKANVANAMNEDFGKLLFDRLNKGEIKRSTLRVVPQQGRRLSSVVPPDGKTGGMTAQELQAVIQNAHDVLWPKLIGGNKKKSTIRLHCYPADLLARKPLLASRYGEPTDIIHIVFPGESLDNSFCLRPNAANGEAPGWETELVHELVHEHRKKLIQQPTAEGRAMWAQEKNPFPCKKAHDEWFYTAICACAPKLGFGSPQEFRNAI